MNSRDVSDVRARETKEHERESAREASAAIVRRPTPTGKVDVSRQEMLEALARELDETESLLGTTKRTTEGERAMSVGFFVRWWRAIRRRDVVRDHVAARGGARRRRSRAKRSAGARVSAMGSATETREMERNNDGHVCVCVRGRTDVCR